ncbi:MAG TPA: c-type cytochrome, partial [Tepidisphaeraceae bacterium]|nr:c-type cytochrome [Tepidisphaeraceae bacterium]
NAAEIFQALMRVQQFKFSQEGRNFLQQLVTLIGTTSRPQDLKLIRQVLGETKDKQLVFSLTLALSDQLAQRNSLQDFPELKQVFDDAIRIAADGGADGALRLQAIQLLGSARNQVTEDLLYDIFHRGESASIQSAAIAALDRRNPFSFGREIISQWKRLTPQVRSTALTALLKRPERCLGLLLALKSGEIQPSELNSSQLKFLREHPDPALARSARNILGKFAIRPRQQVIDAFMPALEARGDFEKGKKIFLERCASCHRLGNDGFALGPDLVTVKNSGKEKLLVNIIDPNREVASQYSAWLVETKDGDSILGIIVNDTASSITLRQAYGLETVVLRNNIKKLKNQGQSLMPEGLEDGLKPQNIADLVEFITSLK